jgi:MOSC domain-containing protein YiiM
MKVISTNISQPRLIQIGSEKMYTGMYKYPVADIFLESDDVKNDVVVDRKYHGGPDMACYIFGQNHYAYFQKMYPDADWETGMFGENITLETLDESQMNVGDVYQIGEAKVQIAQPRIPCSKLGYRLGNPNAIRSFAEANYPGVYVRVLKSGKVKVGDEMRLVQSCSASLSIVELYRILIQKSASREQFQRVIDHPEVPVSIKEKLKE